MGFDKGDMAFCIHLGLPPSPVAYYQQIGRAGRAISTAHVVALPRPAEDAAIWRWFESVSLPSEEICTSLLNLLDDAATAGVGTFVVCPRPAPSTRASSNSAARSMRPDCSGSETIGRSRAA